MGKYKSTSLLQPLFTAALQSHNYLLLTCPVPSRNSEVGRCNTSPECQCSAV